MKGTYVSKRTSGNMLCKVGRIIDGSDNQFGDLRYTKFPSFCAISPFSMQFSCHPGNHLGNQGFLHNGSLFGLAQPSHSKKEVLNGRDEIEIPRDWIFKLQCDKLPNLPSINEFVEEFPLHPNQMLLLSKEKIKNLVI